MRTRHQVENPFRNAVECWSGAALLSGTVVVWQWPHLFLLMGGYQIAFIVLFGSVGIWRFAQGIALLRFQRRLKHLKAFAMAPTTVPLIEGVQYLGQGFAWEGRQTQRKYYLSEVDNERYHLPSQSYRWVRHYCRTHQNLLATCLASSHPCNPWRPLPDIGGKAWLHGLGDSERAIGLLESQRNGHVLILGTTGVGKTRLLSIMVNQDIRRGKSVIVLDPKGDLEILRDMYAACAAADRLADMAVVHVGFPNLSARLNTLSSYSDISDVATRVTSAMNAEGEGAQFKDFAWKYLNITAKCLKELNKPINYRTLSFYVTRPALLLMTYADTVWAKKDPKYLDGVSQILRQSKAAYEELSAKDVFTVDQAECSRVKAVRTYLGDYIEALIAADQADQFLEEVIVPLYGAADLTDEYYQKITASVSPILDKINQSNACDIFSFDPATIQQPEVVLIEAIKRQQVIYIGLNSLVNREVSEALGKAIISDLVSCAGRIYNVSESYTCSLYCDEFSEIVQDEFVTLLNKSRGAGFQITAACQTINDLGAAFSSNHDKAKQLEGNFQSQIVMRVKNKDTAMVLIDQLNEVPVMTRMEGSSATDTPHGEDGVYFHTSNDTRLSLTNLPMLQANDLISLPKGQAFVLTHGGELSKVRLPLPINDSTAPADFTALIEQVNTQGGSYASTVIH